MANWEYKVISSGKGGFASPALMEKFINDLGQEQWEIINFHTAPDNALAFTGLARRPVMRDWTLEDAAAAAARTETDKLRVEFEAKFKAVTTGAAAPTEAEDRAETLIEEKAAADDGFRRPKDTERDGDPDAPEGDWDKLAAEDELPTFFDALKPHMRNNQRGPGQSVGVDFLAKKWKLEEAEIRSALVECGMQIPADENAKPVYVEYDGDLFWVNINRRGETWINTREKPDPVFRIVAGTPVAAEDAPADTIPAPAPRREESPREPRPAALERQPREPRQEKPRPEPRQESGPQTLLAKIRGMMRRNRRGHGWSGSFPYLTKALKLDEAALLAQLGEFGLRLEGGTEPVVAEENGFTYWLNRNQRDEIWINAEEKREGGGQQSEVRDQPAVEPARAHENPSADVGETKALPPENILTAVRLLMQPKKRGEGVTAPVPELAAKLEKSDQQVLALLASTGLHLPESPKAKPTFAEHGGEIYWLNANAKGQVWLNAKQSAATRKAKAKKSDE
ncbi:MAG: hypothetical protein PSW75_05445 [bacterium]|nr:hypothetical protein [bacterium]